VPLIKGLGSAALPPSQLALFLVRYLSRRLFLKMTYEKWKMTNDP
jgi:hypothetical protein